MHDPIVSESKGLSLGSGFAIVGLWLVAAPLTAFFFCILSYTSVMVNVTTMYEEDPANRVTRYGTYLAILILTPAPAIVAYRLSRAIINRG